MLTQQLPEHHRDFASRQVSAETKVRARRAEAVVVIGRASDVEDIGVIKMSSSRLAEL